MMPPGAAVAADRAFMRRAIGLARRGLGCVAPNPMVGAVVVVDGEIVGEGFHAEYGGEHAEATALRQAGSRAAGSTLYVTLEPCAHAGKTPPCTDAVIAAGVRRVVAAVRDPNPLAAGGFDRLLNAGIEVQAGVEEGLARELIAHFLHGFGSDRPFVTLKLAVSMDAAVADAAGGSRWITGRRARREVHRLRAGHDAVAIGIGTALADDPVLTVRGTSQPRVAPSRVVFDRTARLPPTSRLVATAREVPTLVVAEAPPAERVADLKAAGVSVIVKNSLASGLRELRVLGIGSVLVEGGARLAGAFLEARLVDRLIIFQAPVILGAGALAAFGHAPSTSIGEADRWRVVERRRLGEDLMTVYALRESECLPES